MISPGFFLGAVFRGKVVGGISGANPNRPKLSYVLRVVSGTQIVGWRFPNGVDAKTVALAEKCRLRGGNG